VLGCLIGRSQAGQAHFLSISKRDRGDANRPEQLILDVDQDIIEFAICRERQLQPTDLILGA
jgi:hypothetical protein